MNIQWKNLIAPGAMIAAIGVNYTCHKTGLPTLCHNTRKTLHTETVAGKVGAVSIIACFLGWFVPHLILKKNQHHIA